MDESEDKKGGRIYLLNLSLGQTQLTSVTHKHYYRQLPNGGEKMSGILTAIGYLFKELFFLVSYVKNNAFPQPLSASDERKYLRKMAEGDEEARNILIEHNLRLVAHIVKML